MTAPSPGLRRQDLSAIGRSASDVSARGQRVTKRLIRTELLTLILAGVAGLSTFRVGPAHLDVPAAVAGALFLVSLSSLIYRSLRKPEWDWYSGRAAAESVRTLAWCYAVGGKPFPSELPDDDAAKRYLDRLAAILRELQATGLAATAPTDSELTPAMKTMRAASFADRRAAYRRDRIQDQIDWYTSRAGQHERAADFWLRAAAAVSVLGVVAAVLRLVGAFDIDVLGVAAACATAAIAWNQLNQNRNLVTAYRVTARELAIIRDRLDYVDESEWATFVSDAEEAVSREHTLWLARHGHTGTGHP
jgi:SMODS and SLOG-associating 2TM effector domain 3/SMODS and SLOG-associating 2TM effector domain 1